VQCRIIQYETHAYILFVYLKPEHVKSANLNTPTMNSCNTFSMTNGQMYPIYVQDWRMKQYDVQTWGSFSKQHTIEKVLNIPTLLGSMKGFLRSWPKKHALKEKHTTLKNCKASTGVNCFQRCKAAPGLSSQASIALFTKGVEP